MKLYVLTCLLLGSLYGYAQHEPAPRLMALESPEMEGYLKNKKPGTVTIKVINRPASAGRMEVSYILAGLGAQTRAKLHTEIGKDGTATIVQEENLPYRQVSIWVDSLLYTIVVVNTELVIEIDMAITKGKKVSYGGEGVNYSGEDGALNRVLVEKEQYRKEEREALEGYLFNQSIKTSNRLINVDTYLKRSDSIYRELVAMDDAFISKHPGYAAIIRNETNSFFYRMVCIPFKTRLLPDSLWQRVKAHQPFFVSTNGVHFYQQLSQYIVNKTGNPEQKKQSLLYQHYASYSAEQRSILDSITYYEQLGGQEREKSKQQLKALIIKRHTHFAVEAALLVEKLHIAIIDSSYPNTRGDLLKISLMDNLKQYYALAYPVLSNHVQTAWCKRIVDRQLAESSGKQQEVDNLRASDTTKPDRPHIGTHLMRLPFGADLYRLDSIGKVDDLIISLKSTFAGKALLIDFWGTWCVPCLKDMPYSKKLHEENKDLPVAYVYLCTTGGSDEKTWKKQVEDMKLPGTHIYVDDAIISELKRKFDAKPGFPEYVVIDLEGHASASKISYMRQIDRSKLKEIIGLRYAQPGAAPQPLPLENPEMDGYLKNRKPATVTIQVDHLPASRARTGIEYVLVQLGARSQTKKFTQLNSKGAATLVLEDNLPYQQVWLTVDSLLYTGIVVNTNLHIRIDADITKGKEIYLAGEGLTFSGADGDLNTVLNAHTLFRKEEQDKLESYFVNQSLAAANKQITMATFLQTADSAYRQLKAIDDAFITRYPSYGEIIRNETNSMFYGWYCVPFRNRDMPAGMWERIKAHQPYFVSNDGVAFYQQVSYITIYNSHSGQANIQQLLYTQYASYNKVQQSILDSVQYYEQLSGPEKEKSKQELKALYNKRYKLFENEQTLLMANRQIKIIDSTYAGPRADLLKVCLMNSLKEHYGITYPVLLANIGTAWCKKIVRSQLNESIARQKETDSLYRIAKNIKNDKLYIGKPLVQLAFGADLYRLDSIGKADDFIINLQAKFKGKAIIIDFWATWCAPCLSDLPRSKKLHEDNKDLPIEYVYLCTTGGSDEKTWKKYVAEIKASGTHIFVDDVIVTEIKRKFNAEGGFPAYVVIDLAGNGSASKISFMGALDREKLKQVTGL